MLKNWTGSPGLTQLLWLLLKIPSAGSRLLQKHRSWPTDLEMPAAFASLNHTEQSRTRGPAVSVLASSLLIFIDLESTHDAFFVLAASKRLVLPFSNADSYPRSVLTRGPHTREHH